MAFANPRTVEKKREAEAANAETARLMEKLHQEQKRLEEQRRLAEQKRLEEERRLEEQKRLEQQRQEQKREEQKRQAEQQKLQEQIKQAETKKLEMQKQLEEAEKRQKQIQQQIEQQRQAKKKEQQIKAQEQKLKEQTQKDVIQKQLSKLEREMKHQKLQLETSRLGSRFYQNNVIKEKLDFFRKNPSNLAKKFGKKMENYALIYDPELVRMGEQLDSMSSEDHENFMERMEKAREQIDTDMVSWKNEMDELVALVPSEAIEEYYQSFYAGQEFLLIASRLKTIEQKRQELCQKVYDDYPGSARVEKLIANKLIQLYQASFDSTLQQMEAAKEEAKVSPPENEINTNEESQEDTVESDPESGTVFSDRWKEEGKKFRILKDSSPDTRLPLASIDQNQKIAVSNKYLIDLMKMGIMDEKSFYHQHEVCKEQWKEIKSKLRTAQHQKAREAFRQKVIRPELEKSNLNKGLSIGIEAVLYPLNLTKDEVPAEVMQGLKYQTNQLYKAAFQKNLENDAAFLQKSFLVNPELVKLAIGKLQATSTKIQEPMTDVSLE